MKKSINFPLVVFLGVLALWAATWFVPDPPMHRGRVMAAASSFTTCDQTRTLTTLTGSASGTAATQLVALSAGNAIYVCSVTVVGTSGTNPTFSLVSGTGTNCATNQAVLLPAIATAANTPIVFPGPLLGVAPVGAALCYLDGGTTPVQAYIVNYAQG